MKMEFLGNIQDITIIKGEEHKIKVRTIESEEDHTIVDKTELIINKEGKIIIQ